MFAVVIIYGIIWSWISLLRYYSFNANVFDLGLASSYLYSFSHGAVFPTLSSPTPLPAPKMIVLVMAPFYYFFPDPQWLLVFQAFWLSLGAVPIYKIFRKTFEKSSYAMMFASAYLLYYPLCGVYWFDFHFQAIFPTFFLIGYWLRIANRIRTSTVAFAFGIISVYLAPLIMIIYAVADAVRGKFSAVFRSHLKQDVVLIAISLIVFIGAIGYYGYLIPLSYVGINGTDTSAIYNATILDKAAYLFRMQFPVGFLSFLSPETLIMAVPYYVMAFVNNYQPYISTMYFQYPALTAPFIFISAIYGMERLPKRDVTRHSVTRTTKSWKGAVVVIFVLSLLLFSFYSPIGEIYNSHTLPGSVSNLVTGNDYSYNAKNYTTIQPYDTQLSIMIKQIPKGSSVLIQNNMPQLTAGYNWSLPDFLPAGFTPQYIVVDPYSYYYDHYSAVYHKDNYTMETLSAFYLLSSNYSVLAQYNSIVIYKSNTV